MDRSAIHLLLIIGVMGLVVAIIAHFGMKAWDDGLTTYHDRIVSGEIDPVEQIERLQRHMEAEDRRRIAAAEAAEAAARRRDRAVVILLVVLAVGAVGGRLYLNKLNEDAKAKAAAQPPPEEPPQA